MSDTGDDEGARRSLVRVGLDHIDGFLQRGMPGWIDEGLEFTRTTQLSMKEVADLAPNTQIVDVRSDKEWSGGHIEGALYIPLEELQSRTEELSKTSPLITACGSGYRSSIAASLLQAGGFSKISSMEGGMTAWNQQQLPTVFS